MSIKRDRVEKRIADMGMGLSTEKLPQKSSPLLAFVFMRQESHSKPTVASNLQ